MCKFVDSPGIIAGWGCHICKVYNGLHRKMCRNCLTPRCTPLEPDDDTGRTFETFEEAYADKPDVLARVRAQIR